MIVQSLGKIFEVCHRIASDLHTSLPSAVGNSTMTQPNDPTASTEKGSDDKLNETVWLPDNTVVR